MAFLVDWMLNVQNQPDSRVEMGCRWRQKNMTEELDSLLKAEPSHGQGQVSNSCLIYSLAHRLSYSLRLHVRNLLFLYQTKYYYTIANSVLFQHN